MADLTLNVSICIQSYSLIVQYNFNVELLKNLYYYYKQIDFIVYWFLNIIVTCNAETKEGVKNPPVPEIYLKKCNYLVLYVFKFLS